MVDVARKPRPDALARERKRRSQHDAPPSKHAPASAASTRRAAAARCGWCGGDIAVKVTGRIPKWCSPTCRQRAWEQSRAAASGRSAVEVVERVVEVPVAHEGAPRREQWPPLLRELTAQLYDGRVYARDLPDLGAVLGDLVAAYNRRQNPRRPRR
jgi:hypothetical protein